jgi:hypothetical protein
MSDTPASPPRLFDEGSMSSFNSPNLDQEDSKAVVSHASESPVVPDDISAVRNEVAKKLDDPFRLGGPLAVERVWGMEPGF